MDTQIDCLVGKILQVNDPTGTYAFAYDNMGRLTGTTTTYSFLPNTPYTNSYSYDADSNRTGFTAPDGSTNTYTYDTLNRLSTLANSWAGSFGFSYDALSRRTQMTRPNGIATNYSYDKLSHLLSVLHQAGTSTIDGDAYTLDAAGNRTAKTDYLAGVTSNYTYDKIYELTQVMQGTNTTESYSYDPVGNRLSSLGVASYNYNTSNELTSSSSGSYTYDANGNTLTDASGKSYAWDFENRLKQVTLPNSGGTVTFLYDPFGRRIQKVYTTGANPPTTTTTNYLYDHENLIETVDQNGNALSRFAQGQGTDEALAESTAGTTSYYEQDGLDSVMSLTNTVGHLTQTYTYDSFGRLTNSSGSSANYLRYTGREFDSKTGIYYYRARYYDPATGRFLSEDPIGFTGEVDFYGYVGNDSTTLIDPTGMQHKPGSPWHPASGIKFGCKWHDDCATLSWKIQLFKKLIAGHQAWDAAHGTDFHTATGDIQSFINGLNHCIYIHQVKCTNKGPCKTPEPSPEPAPSPEMKPLGGPLPPPIGLGEAIEEILEALGALAG